MPVVFIISGLICLSIIFNFIKFNNSLIKYLVIVYLSFLCISYFISLDDYVNISFNSLQVVLITFLLLYSFIKCNHKLSLLLISLMNTFIYFVLIKTNILFVDNFSSADMCALLISIGGGLLCVNIYNGLFICICSIVGMSIMGVVVELEYYTFAYFNLDFVFLVLTIYVGFQYFRNFIFCNCYKLRSGKFYNDKKYFNKTIYNRNFVSY